MDSLPFKQVDVFTAVPYQGNPVAVVMGAQSLSGSQMQRIAMWTNLSETAFILPASNPLADYRVRIFTPKGELPFAGHPSLGAAHAVLEAGWAAPREEVLTQECGVGLVRLYRDPSEGRLHLDLPPAHATALADDLRQRLVDAVGVALKGPAAILDLGPRWLTAEAVAIAELLAARVDFPAVQKLSEDLAITGVTLFARDDSATEVRSFAPAAGVPEDPVCGSGNGAVAALLRAQGQSASYRARQGRAVGRDGYAYLEFVPDGPIRLGGDTVTCIDGRLLVPTSA
jgi:PhzF family phenazine biosynthesis protein